MWIRIRHMMDAFFGPLKTTVKQKTVHVGMISARHTTKRQVSRKSPVLLTSTLPEKQSKIHSFIRPD